MKIVYNTCYGGFSLSEKALDECAKRGLEIDSDPDYSYRSHPVLVEVVQALGEGADGSCARLDLQDWEDGVPYIITEYDGIESVEVDWPTLIQKLHEKHGELIPAQLLLSAAKQRP